MEYARNNYQLMITYLLLAWLILCNSEDLKSEERFVLRGPQYPLELFPLIDELQIEKAFMKRHYMKFLLKCVFFQGPCDLVGKWLKPRTLEALRGTCLVCTEYQQENMERWLLSLIHYNEDLFQIAMIKVCLDMKIPVDDEERNKTIPYLTPNDLRDYVLNQPPRPSSTTLLTKVTRDSNPRRTSQLQRQRQGRRTCSYNEPCSAPRTLQGSQSRGFMNFSWRSLLHKFSNLT